MTETTTQTATEKLAVAEQEMQAWYADEFTPYKQQQEQAKQDFTDFAKTIINNTKEVKYMLANIYDNNSQKVVETWNEIGLEPVIKDIKLEKDILTITDDKSNEHSMSFEELLTSIAKVLGE